MSFPALTSAAVSPMPLIEQMDQHGWKPWMFEPSENSFHLMSVKADLTQAIVIKPTITWDKKYQAHKWYDTAEGSTYFLSEQNVAVYIFDFSKKPVNAELKKQVLHMLETSVKNKTTRSSSSFNLFPRAYASEDCEAPIGAQTQVSELANFSNSLVPVVAPFSAEAIWDMLNRCGSKVISETLHDMKKMVTDPIAWMKDTWHGLASVVDFVANFQTTIPKVFENIKSMSATQLFDVLCPVATKILLGILTGKLASDAATISINLIKELKVIKAMMAKAKTLLVSVPKPKLPHLKIMNGRMPEGTLQMQAKSLVSMAEGKFTIGGEALQPMKQYTGLILDDGRMLLQDRNLALHNQLVRSSDKVATAFEVWTDSKGNIRTAFNQSGTYMPDFEGCKTWMKWWVDKQKGLKNAGFEDKLGTGLPFKLVEFKNN
jgi:hypothetical protein